MTQEFGRGVRPGDRSFKVDADGKVRLPVVVTVLGTEKINEIECTKYELRRQDTVQTIDFLRVTDEGVFGVARGDGTGDMLKITPPQKLVGFPLRVGDKWQYQGGGGDQKIDEAYEVVAKESVEVPAGKFDAFHLHIVGKAPYHSVVDRWFVPEIGYVKDVTEVQRADGSLLQRITLELKERPKAGKP